MVKLDLPISFVNSMGGFKNFQLPTSPGIDYAEVMHFSFLIKLLLKICEIYPPGVAIEYTGDGHLGSYIDNLKLSWIENYLSEFNSTLNYYQKLLPQNFKVTHKHFLDFYNFEETAEEIENRFKKEDINSKKNKDLLDKYYIRAKSNFCVQGEKDYSDLNDVEIEEKIRGSVIKTYLWYDLDFKKGENIFQD